MTTAILHTSLVSANQTVHAYASSNTENAVSITLTIQDNADPYASKVAYLTMEELAILRHQLSLVMEAI